MRWDPRKLVVLALRGGLPGLRRVHAQVASYAEAWAAANAEAATGSGPLWVVLGDSTAQGIGATSHLGGYVGQVHRMLEAATTTPWRIVNLSRSGAKAADVLDRQLPALEGAGLRPSLVTCAVGSNDVIRRTPLEDAARDLRSVITRLPPPAVVGTIPQGMARKRTHTLNRAIRDAAAEAGVVVADLHAHTGPPWKGKYAEDWFHPGDLGYADWAAAFAEALAVPPLPLAPRDSR